MSEQRELILRVEAKKMDLLLELEKLKNDVADSAGDNRDKLEKKIKEMSSDIKEAGEGFSEAVAKKINDWLK